MKNAARLALISVMLFALAACQGAPGVSPTETAGPDSTPAGFVLASIEGTVWHDLCDSGADGEPVLTETPPGCVADASALGAFHADGVRQPGEPGLAGVSLALASGKCPGGDVLQTATTDADGAYRFSGLDGGDFCVSIDPSATGNQGLLLPGEWTRPAVQEGPIAYGVGLHPGGSVSALDFGWDLQFSPRHVHAAVLDSARQVRVADTGADLDPQGLPTGGLSPRGGAALGQAFAFSFDPFGVIASDGNSQHDLAFVQSPDSGVTVWSGSGARPPRLAWAVMPQGDDGVASLMVSDLAGADLQTVYSEAMKPNLPTHLLVQGWSADGSALLFSREPWGIGGYIPYGGASSLFSLDLASGQVTTLIDFDPQGRRALCLDGLSPDGSRVASHCEPTQITIAALVGGGETSIAAPSSLAAQPFVLGSARFSPDGSRIAYTLARGNPNEELGWVAVSDGLSGESHVILEGQTGGYYTVIFWLNASTLLLQWNDVTCGPDCPTGLWSVAADGSRLAHVVDGAFAALTIAAAP